MSKFRSGEASAGFLLMISALAIVVGMGISVVRAGTIDRSFNLNIPLSPEHYRSLTQADPDYAQLTDQGKLNAYREAEENDKRPYQFYGNILLAVIILIAGWWSASFKTRTKLPKRTMLALTGVILAVVILYPACRKSYYRYNKAVAAINNYKKT
jgi:hypothetical protein